MQYPAAVAATAIACDSAVDEGECGQRVAKNCGAVDPATSSRSRTVSGNRAVVNNEVGPAGETAGSIEDAAATGNIISAIV